MTLAVLWLFASEFGEFRSIASPQRVNARYAARAEVRVAEGADHLYGYFESTSLSLAAVVQWRGRLPDGKSLGRQLFTPSDQVLTPSAVPPAGHVRYARVERFLHPPTRARKVGL